MPGRFEAEFKLRGSCRPLFLADLGLSRECHGLAHQVICQTKEPRFCVHEAFEVTSESRRNGPQHTRFYLFTLRRAALPRTNPLDKA